MVGIETQRSADPAQISRKIRTVTAACFFRGRTNLNKIAAARAIQRDRPISQYRMTMPFGCQSISSGMMPRPVTRMNR